MHIILLGLVNIRSERVNKKLWFVMQVHSFTSSTNTPMYIFIHSYGRSMESELKGFMKISSQGENVSS